MGIEHDSSKITRFMCVRFWHNEQATTCKQLIVSKQPIVSRKTYRTESTEPRDRRGTGNIGV